jgi:hypothetical protein
LEGLQVFKKCFIHIGTEKTGSTSIQRYLEKNRSKLLEKGHYYPERMGPKGGSHYYLCVFSRHESQIDDLRIISDVTNVEELLHFRQNFVKNIDNELTNIDAEYLHISCENFHSRLQGIDSIEMLKALLKRYTIDFEIICYLRPQHEVAISLYSTDMKLGGITETAIPKVGVNNHYYNYNLMLTKWEQVFGRECIKVIDFNRSNFFGSDLISDYCYRTSVNNVDFDNIAFENESLTRPALEFLKGINQFIPRIKDSVATGFRRNIAQLFEREYSGKGYLCTRYEAMAFFEQFKEENEKLMKRHGISLFSNVDFKSYPPSFDSELTTEEVKNIAIKILEASGEYDFDYTLITKNNDQQSVYKAFSELWLSAKKNQ